MAEIVSKPGKRTELCNELDLSRSTIYRGLDQLAQQGLVTEHAGIYEPTKIGSMVYDKYLELEKMAGKLSISQELVETVYSLEPSPPQSIFLNATVFPSNQYVPAEKLKLVEETIRESSTVRCILSTIYPEIITTLRERTHNDSPADSLLLSDKSFCYLKRQHKEEITEISHSCEISVYEPGCVPPVSLFLSQCPEELVTIATYGDAGGIREVIKTKNPNAISWSKEYINSEEEKSKITRGI